MLRCTRHSARADRQAGTRAGIWQESAAEVAKFDEEVVCSDANDEPSWKKDSRGEGANDANGVCIRPDWMSTPLAPVVRLLLTYRVVHHTQH